jgi:hypothetical protein
MYASENASRQFIEFLLSEGADPCMKDSEGLTAKDYLIGNAPSNYINPNLTDKDTREISNLLECKSTK